MGRPLKDLTGMIIESNNCGKFKVLERTNKKTGNSYIYVVEFIDNYYGINFRKESDSSSIIAKNIKNPYYPIRYGVACFGKPKDYVEDIHIYFYRVWAYIVESCYNKNHLGYNNHGINGITICNKWLCFEYFFEDIKKYKVFYAKDVTEYKLRLINGNEFNFDNCVFEKLTDKFIILDNKNIVGQRYNSNNYGYFTVLSKTKENRINIEFDEINGVKYTCSIHISSFRKGNIKNPYYPIVAGVGYTADCEIDSTTREYDIWYHMLNRCYNSKASNYKNYGEKGVVVDRRWHNFQNFCEDIQHLDGYNEWKESKRGEYHLDKDIKQTNVENKIYSKDTCMFVLYYTNIKESNMRNAFKSKYKAKNILSGEEFIIYNLPQFIRDNGFTTSIYSLIKKGKTYKNYKIEKIEDKQHGKES